MYIKFRLTVILFFSVLFCKAQEGPNPDEMAMLKAENAFAQMAKDKNTKAAFLNYIRPDAISFDKSGVVLMKEQWEKRKADTSLLLWRPDFSLMAASGDFGIDAGPYEYRNGKSQKNPLGTGHFITIWKKENAEWKVALDMGINHPATESIRRPDGRESPSVINYLQLAVKPFYGDAGVEFYNHELKLVEDSFDLSLKKKGMRAYEDALSIVCNFYHNGKPPFIAPDPVSPVSPSSVIQLLPANVIFKPTGSMVASSGDIGAVYGSVEIGLMTGGQPVSKQANYLHIWRREPGLDNKTRWRLLVEVLADKDH